MTEATSTVDIQALAQTCAEGDCAHAHTARTAEQRVRDLEYAIEHARDYLDNRDGITPEVASTLRGILGDALQR